MPETKTRTRKDTPSDKQVETDEAKARAAAKKAETEAARAAKKAADEAEKAAKAAAREQERAEKAAAKAAEKAESDAAKEAARAEKEQERAAERQTLIDAGSLIIDGEIEYVETESFKKDLVATRAAGVIEHLKANGRTVPVMGKTLVDEFGGGTVQWVSFMGILRSQGLIRVYRSHSGERGGSGQAYLWIGQ